MNCGFDTRISYLAVASVLITSSKLAIGTYEGEVYVHDLGKLLENKPMDAVMLKAHIRTVYSLATLSTALTPDGFTSVFPTFLGKARENVEHELLISIGYGRGYPELPGEPKSKAFSTFCQQSGCYINTWFL